MPLSSTDDLEQKIRCWNNTETNYDLETQTLHSLIEHSTSKYKDKTALIYENQSWTFQEINNQANQLAHYLRSAGIGPDTCVGVLMERSLEMVVSLYGVIKAGGAYLPIDPEHPQERIEYILQESRTPIVLTSSQLESKLPRDMRNLLVDRDWSDIAQQSSTNPPRVAKPSNLAYVIYTSGSTGNPKGVMNEHRGICNRLLWMQDAIPLSEDDRVLQKTPFTFDVSVWEFFPSNYQWRDSGVSQTRRTQR